MVVLWSVFVIFLCCPEIPVLILNHFRAARTHFQKIYRGSVGEERGALKSLQVAQPPLALVESIILTFGNC